ncbi:MAG: hypothetical protein DYG92_07340 [Leptolyngbya sp. PLA1]|nr:hypothetical protein [Leptolyngbya sp. PLA1]
MKRMALVSLMVCGGLVLAWWLLGGRPQPPGPAALPSWVTGLGEAGVSLVEVRARGQVVRFEQSVGGTWLWRSEADETWPAQPERVRAALRLLAEARPAGNSAGEPMDSAAEVLITIDGAVRRLRVGTQALGGMTPMEVEDETGRMVSALGQAGLAPVFEPASLLAWRADRALAGGQTEPSVLRVRAGEDALGLARARGRWTLAAPVMAEAETEVVQRALAGLMEVRVVRFVPREDVEPGVTDTPSVVIVVESEARRLEGGDVQSRTLVQELRLGPSLGGGNATHLARIQAEWVDPATRARVPAWGPAYAAVSAGAVSLPTRAEAVISRVAWNLALSDVRELWLCAPGVEGESQPVATFSRGVGEWARTSGAGGSGKDAAGVAAVASLLAEVRAERVQVPPPEGVEWLSTVHAAVGGKSVRQCEIGVGGDGRVVVRGGGVCRVYGAETAGAAAGFLRAVIGGGR